MVFWWFIFVIEKDQHPFKVHHSKIHNSIIWFSNTFNSLYWYSTMKMIWFDYDWIECLWKFTRENHSFHDVISGFTMFWMSKSEQLHDGIWFGECLSWTQVEYLSFSTPCKVHHFKVNAWITWSFWI